MINIVKAVLEAAETNDFSLKSIDPREKSYNEETDNALYKEAYEKACIGIKTCYDSHEKLYREVISNVRYECQRTNINQDIEKNVELHIISVNPQIDFNVMKLLDDFFTSTDMSKFNSSDEFLTTLKANVISQMGSTPISKEGYIGPVVNLPMKGILVAENLNMIERNIMNAADELYSVYEFIGKKIAEEKNPMYLEAYARMFEYCAKLISYEIGAYGVAALELLQVGRNIMPINKSTALNEGVEGIFNGILIAPIVLAAGMITFGILYNKIQDVKNSKEAKKQGKKLSLLKDNKNIVVKNYEKLIKNAKFAKYNPDVIYYIDELIKVAEKYEDKIKKLDNELFKIKTIDEFNKKKESLTKEYSNLNKLYSSDIKSISNKYKNSKKEWVSDLNIIPVLTKYVKLINNTGCYWRNLSESDWWTHVDFLNVSYEEHEDNEKSIEKAFIDAYKIFSIFNYYYVTDRDEFKEPFSMIKIQFTGDTLNESAALLETTNEENAKKYIDEIDKLIDEIRAFYDKFEYKEIIIPRKKKEPKMYEYVLGALQRKYTLRIPIYKVEGAFDNVKDIVEHKFIDKLESITKKYPNFVIMSPNWENDSDMFIYITLREPFGEKEDRKNREGQVQNESAFNDPMATSIDIKIEHLKKKIEMNEKVQDRYIEKNGYENKSLAEEHDKMCDQMEELCRQRREANNAQNESIILEASLSKSEKDALEDYEFGLPEKRTYPLNDEVRIKQAIKFFGYCRASDKRTLADNIVRRIIELDLVGVVTISPSHPNKKFFPEWMLNTCKPTLERKCNKYTIYVDGEKVDYGTLEDHSSSDEGARVVVVNESGNLF